MNAQCKSLNQQMFASSPFVTDYDVVNTQMKTHLSPCVAKCPCECIVDKSLYFPEGVPVSVLETISIFSRQCPCECTVDNKGSLWSSKSGIPPHMLLV